MSGIGRHCGGGGGDLAQPVLVCLSWKRGVGFLFGRGEVYFVGGSVIVVSGYLSGILILRHHHITIQSRKIKNNVCETCVHHFNVQMKSLFPQRCLGL